MIFSPEIYDLTILLHDPYYFGYEKINVASAHFKNEDAPKLMQHTLFEIIGVPSLYGMIVSAKNPSKVSNHILKKIQEKVQTFILKIHNAHVGTSTRIQVQTASMSTINGLN